MEKNKMDIKTNNEELKGVYSNMALVSHKKEEFILDFLMVLPPTGVLSSRVIVSPGHLKRLIKTLQESLGKYEDQFGPIKESSEAEEEKIGFVT